jgi:hypothetical protein
MMSAVFYMFKPIRRAIEALLYAALIFMVVEPTLGTAATTATSQFRVAEVVSSEISFYVTAQNIVLSPSLGGLTGGTSNGGTQVVVITGGSLGYQMTLLSSSSVGMIGNASSTNSIPALPNALTPTYNFDSGSVAANKAYNAYTIEASTTADLTQTFMDNGSSCNTGSSDTANKCWLNASTTAVTLINRSIFTAPSGSTSTIKFRVVMQPSPLPVIPDDVYVSTSTLTVTNN